MIKLTIEIYGEDDSTVDLGLEEVTRLYSGGYLKGQDKNETGSFKFQVEEVDAQKPGN